jgi:hypothetical protein
VSVGRFVTLTPELDSGLKNSPSRLQARSVKHRLIRTIKKLSPNSSLLPTCFDDLFRYARIIDLLLENNLFYSNPISPSGSAPER